MTITVKLQQRNIKTSDFYHTDGVYGFCCHDLTQFGATGASIAASTSAGRYAWVFSADHPSQNFGWADGQNFFIGYSNDPGIPPETVQTVIRSTYLSSDPRNVSDQFTYYHFNDLVYNPDDTTYPFYLYAEGFIQSGPDAGLYSNHECGLLRSSDTINWSGIGGAMQSVAFGGFTSFQRVTRSSSSSWFSIGPNDTGAPGIGFQIGKWTSSDAIHWATSTSALNRTFTSGASFNDPMGQPLTVTISSQSYIIGREDARTVPGDGGMYVTAAPVDSNYNVVNSSAAIRVSGKYDGVFPSLGYLQQVHLYQESGIQHVWASHGFFSEEANPNGGMHEQSYDYYTFIYDATTAANAPPVGVKAECRYGAVIISWYDALPSKTYRVYKSTDGGATYPSHVDMTGLKYIDPAGGVNAIYYYKIVTLNSGVEQGNRIVHTYVSNARSLTNKHVTRVTDAGGTNINIAWVDAAVGWLTDNGLIDECLFWADPSFGVIKNGSNQISTVFCLGTTIHPRGGDYTPQTPASTVYNATGMNGTIPAFVNSAGTAHGWFGNGRFNNIRRKAEITFGAVYARNDTNTATLLATSEFSGITLQHTSGAPGVVQFQFNENGSPIIAATQVPTSSTGANIVLGTFNSIGLQVYVSGVSGAVATGVTTTAFTLDGQPSATQGTQMDFLGTGSADIKWRSSSGYLFSENQGNFTCSALFVFERGLTPWQANSINSLLNTRIGGASYTIPSYSTPFVKNIITDYGAVGNGSTDDSTAFGNFATAASSWQSTNSGLVVLQIPAASNFYLFSGSAGKTFTQGINRLVLLGEDRTTSVLGDGGSGAGFFLGNANGIYGDNTHSARIQTVSAGATSITQSVTLVSSLMNAGDNIEIAGIDMQGFGFPNNPYYFEFPTVQSVSSAVVTFTAPLQYGYESTWPLYSSGSGSTPDLGGPGTLYILHPGWNCEQEYIDIGTDQTGIGVQTKAPGRLITFTRCADTGNGMTVTETGIFRANDLDHSLQQIEMDKVVKKAIFNGGLIKQYVVQSASIDEMIIRGCTQISSGTLQGTPKNFYSDGIYATNQAGFGPTVYGSAEKVIALNGSIVGGLLTGGSAESDILSAGYSMSPGSLTFISSAHGPSIWAIPNKRVFVSGTLTAQDSFIINDISASGGNTIISIDQTWNLSGLPGTIGIHTSPAPIFTMRGITGGPVTGVTGGGKIAAVIFTEQDLSTVNPPGASLYSASNRTYGYLNLSGDDPIIVWGKLISIVVNVTTAYTGTQATLLYNIFGQFGARCINSLGQIVTWNPQIDLKTSGSRTLLPTGGTPFGIDSGLTPPANPIWLADVITPFVNHDVTSESTSGPVATITYSADQTSMPIGTFNATPLRLRLKLP